MSEHYAAFMRDRLAAARETAAASRSRSASIDDACYAVIASADHIAKILERIAVAIENLRDTIATGPPDDPPY